MIEIEIKGKKLDLSPVLPLKLRDWKELEKRGANAKQFDNGAITAMSIVAFYVLSKLDKTITQDDVDDLELNNSALQTIMQSVGGAKEVDRPFLTSSTSSPDITDGENGI